MNSIVLFLGMCIPARLFIAWSSTKIPAAYLPYFATVLLLVAIAFLYLYFTGSRMQAPEAGGATWWASYRLIIGLLWLAAAIYAFQGKNNMIWVPLVIDVLLGMVLFYYKHFA
jgi:hypothetical protein